MYKIARDIICSCLGARIHNEHELTSEVLKIVFLKVSKLPGVDILLVVHLTKLEVAEAFQAKQAPSPCFSTSTSVHSS
jgi:hypothetical protein